MRLFIAVDIDDKVKASMSKVINLLNTYRGIKTVEPENIHITLQFLGEVKEYKLDLIADRLSNIKIHPFKIHIKGVGYFPNKKLIRVVWAGVDEGKDEISKLAEDVRSRMKKLGFKEDKNFVAHATIARVKRISQSDKEKLIKDLENVNDDFGWYEVKNFKLKQSTLTPKGPIYRDLQIYNLE